MSTVLFILKDDALIVANTGKEFSREGVISICNMNLSTKDPSERSTPVDVYGDSLGGQELIDSISGKREESYRLTINDLIEHVKYEKAVHKSYTGRFIWELLQNAEDAADKQQVGAQLIGAKGTGFKSVLEITSEPEIYSGEFSFHFSRDRSRKILSELPDWNEEMGIPVCRFPHNKVPDDTVKSLLGKGYTTVIRLPIRKEKAEDVERMLCNFDLSKMNTLYLLFCQHLEAIEVRTENREQRITVNREHGGSIVEISDRDTSKRWRVWRRTTKVDGEKQVSVSLCLPFDGKVLSKLEGEYPINVFFPTKEKVCGVHAAIHVSCEVEQNREYLAKGQPHLEEILKLLKEIVKDILLEVPADLALQAFGLAKDETSDQITNQLEATISRIVRETAFVPVIGGKLARPEDVVVWKYNLGNVLREKDQIVQERNLCSPEISQTGEHILSTKLCAKKLTIKGHARFLQFCRNTTLEDCMGVWDIAQLLIAEASDDEKSICAENLRKVPFWWTTKGVPRAIDGDVRLSVAKPKDLPKWLTVDIVDRSFVRRIKERIKSLEADSSWKNGLSENGVAPLGKLIEYFNHILLPYCKDKSLDWWKRFGFDVLKVAFLWGGEYQKSNPLIINSGADIEERAKIIHLPVTEGEGEWRPALQCYAGAAWNGPEIFDHYFANVEDRHLLSLIEDWNINGTEKDKKRLKRRLLWLGCSWTPKLTREQNWSCHLKQEGVPRNYTPGRGITTFHFEHFDNMLSQRTDCGPSGNFISIDLGRDMYEISRNCIAKYFYQIERTCDSYAQIQMQRRSWVPCGQSLIYPEQTFFPPKDVYLPGCGLGGLFPEVDTSWLGNEDSIGIMDMLVKLGAHNDISTDEDELIGYMRNLSDCANRVGANLLWDRKRTGAIARAADSIFSAYSKIKSHNNLPADVMIPCISGDKKKEILYFKRVDSVLWADESYFDKSDVRKIILTTKDLYVFFRFLRYGEGFGLEKLSERLNMEPSYGQCNPHKGKILWERYRDRYKGLMMATGQELPKPQDIDIIAYEELSLRSNEYRRIQPTIRCWTIKDDRYSAAINSGSKSNEWTGLAAALGEIGNCSQYQSDFELLLKERRRSDFLHRLQDNYGLTEDSIREMDPVTRLESGDEMPVNNSPGVLSSRAPSTSSYHPQVESSALEVDVRDSTQRGGRRGGDSGGYSFDQDGSQAAREIGEHGEKVLYNWLCREFGQENVTNENVGNPNNPGYDILVIQDGEEHYYECKSSGEDREPRHVEMKRAQLELAREKKEKYKLCVMYNCLAGPVRMLGPIPNPAELEKEPIVEKYRVYLTSHDGNTEP